MLIGEDGSAVGAFPTHSRLARLTMAPKLRRLLLPGPGTQALRRARNVAAAIRSAGLRQAVAHNAGLGLSFGGVVKSIGGAAKAVGGGAVGVVKKVAPVAAVPFTGGASLLASKGTRAGVFGIAKKAVPAAAATGLLFGPAGQAWAWHNRKKFIGPTAQEKANEEALQAVASPLSSGQPCGLWQKITKVFGAKPDCT